MLLTLIILPKSSRIIKGQTSLVFGTKMNVVTESLKRGDPPLLRGLHLWPSHTRYNCGSQKVHVALYNTKPVVIQKGTLVGHMVATNVTPEKVLLPGTLETLDLPKNNEARQLSIEECREKLFKKLDLLGLESWTQENKEKPWIF